MTVERWKPIKGWQGYYEISDHGRVKSLARVIQRSSGPMTIKERIVGNLNADGYRCVTLSSPKKQREIHIHVLVGEAFLKRSPNSDRVCHKDDDPQNNYYKNLYWGNASSNGKDAYKNGKHNKRTYLSGIEIYNAIPDKTVLRVKRLRLRGMIYRDIADKCALSRDTVQAICSGRGRFGKFPWNL